MPIDPDIALMLEAAKLRKATVALADIPIEELREGYSARYLERSIEPHGVVQRKVHPVRTQDWQIDLVTYTPADAPAPRPGVLYYHGGGFVLGDDRGYSRQSANIALACGATVGFVEFRRAPEAPFPAAVEDSVSAAEWFVEHAHELGVDPHRIALMGDSAGANLAINVAETLSRGQEASQFRTLCLLYPVADFRPYFDEALASQSDRDFALDHGLDFLMMRYFGDHYLRDPELRLHPAASPILSERLGKLPRTSVFVAQYDVLRDQGIALADRLKAEGVRVDLAVVEAMIHNFMGHAGISATAERAFSTVCEAVRHRLHDQPKR